MEVMLFPLVNVTLFPGTIKPINVFEPRYVSLIKEAIALKIPVALAYIDDPHKVRPIEVGETVSFVRDIAGYGQVHIVEERTNGTLLTFVQGEGKIRLGKVLDNSKGYLVLDGQMIPEQLVVAPEHYKDLTALSKILNRWVYTNIADAGQRAQFLSNVARPEDVVGHAATYLVRDYDSQQMILEQNDINEKLETLYRIMNSTELTI